MYKPKYIIFSLLLCFNICYAQKFKKIGLQKWATQNLNVNKFANGDFFPEAKTNKEWQDAITQKKPVWCYYDDDSIIGQKLGKLYNYYAVIDSRGLAPRGTHIATKKDWETLLNFLANNGDTKEIGKFMASKEV